MAYFLDAAQVVLGMKDGEVTKLPQCYAAKQGMPDEVIIQVGFGSFAG